MWKRSGRRHECRRGTHECVRYRDGQLGTARYSLAQNDGLTAIGARGQVGNLPHFTGRLLGLR